MFAPCYVIEHVIARTQLAHWSLHRYCLVAQARIDPLDCFRHQSAGVAISTANSHWHTTVQANICISVIVLSHIKRSNASRRIKILVLRLLTVARHAVILQRLTRERNMSPTWPRQALSYCFNSLFLCRTLTSRRCFAVRAWLFPEKHNWKPAIFTSFYILVLTFHKYFGPFCHLVSPF